MKQIVLQLQVPEWLLEYLPVKNLENEIKLLISLELYREGKISLGKAAEIAGLSIEEFLYELRKRDIPINYDLEELEEDLKTMEELK